MEATLNIAGASAGTKKRPSAFSMPIAATATATSGRNGNISRVSRTVSSNLPGTCAKSAANARVIGSAKTMPSDGDQDGDDQQGGDGAAAERPGRLAAVTFERTAERGHEGGRHRALREEIANEVRQPERHVEGVHLVAGAEGVREHLLAHQPQDPARHRRAAGEAGGTGQGRAGRRRHRDIIACGRSPNRPGAARFSRASGRPDG